MQAAGGGRGGFGGGALRAAGAALGAKPGRAVGGGGPPESKIRPRRGVVADPTMEEGLENCWASPRRGPRAAGQHLNTLTAKLNLFPNMVLRR